MNKIKKYCVYQHIAPNGKMYIGITSLKVNERWRNGKGYSHNEYFSRAIKKYGWENIQHNIICEGICKEDAEIKEKELIKKYKTNCKDYGYNIASGGELGNVGLKRSKETLEKMRKANIGKKLDEKTKEKISRALTGRKFTDKHRNKLSLAELGEKNHMYGKKISEETRRKMSNSQPKGKEHNLSIKVCQLNKDTNKLIKVWDSMGEVRRELGLKHCGISDCCRGKQKTSGGFKWMYYEEWRKIECQQ